MRPAEGLASEAAERCRARLPDPTVTVVVPVRDEADRIEGCLRAVEAQEYPGIIEILVVDGGSTDGTAALASTREGVRVLPNPAGRQAAGLAAALAAARGEVVVRIDAGARPDPDYVARCVDVLAETGAALVGGTRRWDGCGWWGRGMALAFGSRLGLAAAGHYRGGRPRWTDSVYLGAGRTEVLRAAGGYDPTLRATEDADLARRAQPLGGVRYDPRIRSVTLVRGGVAGTARKYFRYGWARGADVRRHPGSLAVRHLAPPALLVGVLSPLRRPVGAAYAVAVAGTAVVRARRDAGAAAGMCLCLPVLHLSWGAGFVVGVVLGRHPGGSR